MVNIAVEYWFSYWNNLVKNLIDSDDYNTTIDSPRFLCDDIISEIEYNGFGNSDNRILFKQRLSNWNKRDTIFSTKYKSQIITLLNNFEQEKNLYVLTIVKHIKQSLDNGKYYEDLIAELISILEIDEELNYDKKLKINLYTSLIIAEFIAKNFDLKDIKDFASKIEDLTIQEGGTVIFAPDTFKHLNSQNFNTKEEYYAQIEKFLDNRNVDDIVRNLDAYYYKEPIDCYAIIELAGVKGIIDITIDDINIYSPKIKKYITKSFGNSIEDVDESREKLLVAVPVRHTFLYSSIKEAIVKSSKIIDFFTLYYNTKQKIELCTESIPIVNKNQIVICAKGGLSVFDKYEKLDHKEFSDYMSATEIDHIKESLDKNSSMFIPVNISKVSSTELQLSNAIHWYNKAVVAKNKEDKLLFSWVAIESIFRFSEDIFKNIICDAKKDKKIYAIQKIGASLIAQQNYWNHCYNVFNWLYESITTYQNRIGIPEELIIKASLRPSSGEKIKYKDFFDNLIEIADSIKAKLDFEFGQFELFKNTLYEVDDYYTNKESALDNKFHEVKNDILMIYRLRNLIVHNAVYPAYSISLYAYKAQLICGTIIRFLVSEYKKTNNTLDQILIKKSSEHDVFCNEFDDHLNRLKNLR